MKLNEKQLQQVDAQVKRLLKSGSFYGEVYRKAGISGVSSQEDFEKLPFSSKDDLRNAYPLGIQAVPEEEVVRIHSSSGTTGKPVIIPYTAKDVDDWAIMFARCYETAGITNKDRIQITPAYGLWTAGIGFQLGAEKLGAMTVPMGPGNTDKQLQMMMDLKTTVLTATSSYALLLAEEINKRGLRDKIHLKKGVFGSERWSKKMREYIRNELGNEKAAGMLMNELDKCIERLCIFPESGKLVFDEYLPGIHVRRKIVGKYILFYQVLKDEKVIRILRIVYGRRDMDEVLKHVNS